MQLNLLHAAFQVYICLHVQVDGMHLREGKKYYKWCHADDFMYFIYYVCTCSLCRLIEESERCIIYSARC